MGWRPEIKYSKNVRQGVLVSEEDEDLLYATVWGLRKRSGHLGGRIGTQSQNLSTLVLKRQKPGLCLHGTKAQYKDSNPFNCSRSNVVQVRRSSKTTAHGFLGVRSNPSGRFSVQIMFHSKGIVLGTYDTTMEAARVYDSAVVQLLGEDHCRELNFPELDPLPLADILRARPRKGTRSRFIGVHLRNASKMRWVSNYRGKIKGKGKNYGIQNHSTELEAARAYDALKYADTNSPHGLNFPEDYLSKMKESND